MQFKTINKIIAAKMDEWVQTIKKPKHLQKILNLTSDTKSELTKADHKKIKDFQQKVYQSVCVTGGAIVSMILQDEPNDYDVYFKDKEVLRDVIQYYLNVSSLNLTITDNENGGLGVFTEPRDAKHELKEMGKTYSRFVNNKQVIGITTNAITLTNDVQIVTRFVGDPVEIHKNFDFVHTTNYWTSEEKCVTNIAALQAIFEKRLYYVGSLFPVTSLFRYRKFVQRGWDISAGEILKIAWDCHELALSDSKVLMNQLIGMDALYFIQVIQILEKKESIDRTTVADAINKIFNDEE